MTDRTRFIVLALTFPIMAYTLVGSVLERVVAQEGAYRHLRIFEEVVSLVTSNYVEQVDADLIMQGALWGLAEGLDPQSSYLTPDEVMVHDAGPDDADAGVGLTVTRQYYVQVVAARDGSPAALAGLRPGDYLRQIDGNPTRMMSIVRARQLLRGAPGSTVSLEVIRGNAAEPVTVEIERGGARSANVTSRIAAPGVGYLRIAEFDATTAGAVGAAADTLGEQGAESLVIDLRGTATGAFETGIAAAALFTDADPLVMIEASDERQPVARGPRPPAITAPVALLTNFGTAGAAELFAAALTDAGRAETVGVRTAGRAAEQTLVRLPDGGGLLLSSARYLTASGEPIHRQGLPAAVPSRNRRSSWTRRRRRRPTRTPATPCWSGRWSTSPDRPSRSPRRNPPRRPRGCMTDSRDDRPRTGNAGGVRVVRSGVSRFPSSAPPRARVR